MPESDVIRSVCGPGASAADANTIRRAHAMGTRDSTGRPGRNYWQLRTDYVIDARLDPATATVTGRETVTIHNTSDSTLRELYLRLDQNVFRDNVPRLTPVPEITGGTTVSRLAVNGQSAIMLGDPRVRPQAGAVMATGLTQTLARVALAQPIPIGLRRDERVAMDTSDEWLNTDWDEII